MDFASSFLDSLHTPPHLTSGLDRMTLCGTLYEQNTETSGQLITIYSRGTIDAGYPFFYDINGLDCYCFLYTISGTGRLENKQKTQTYQLTPGSIIFFDCRQHFTLETTTAPWKFRTLFVDGGNLPFYMKNTHSSFGCILDNILSGDFLFFLNMIFQNNTEKDILYKLSDEKNMTNLCAAFLSKYLEKNKETFHIPSYLVEMKKMFDTHYDQTYSLDDLENSLGISKYRLCREFSNVFHESPIHYLNRVRISNSKLLLQNTNMKIHEIGAQVGIENTNHFINLFKRQEGTTPLIYREMRLSK